MWDPDQLHSLPRSWHSCSGKEERDNQHISFTREQCLGLVLLQGHPTLRGAPSVMFHWSFLTLSLIHPFPLFPTGSWHLLSAKPPFQPSSWQKTEEKLLPKASDGLRSTCKCILPFYPLGDMQTPLWVTLFFVSSLRIKIRCSRESHIAGDKTAYWQWLWAEISHAVHVMGRCWGFTWGFLHSTLCSSLSAPFLSHTASYSCWQVWSFYTPNSVWWRTTVPACWTGLAASFMLAARQSHFSYDPSPQMIWQKSKKPSHAVDDKLHTGEHLPGSQKLFIRLS